MKTRRIFSCVLQIGAVVFLLLVLFFAGIAAVIRQPNFGRLPFPNGPRTDPDMLRRHVEFLSQEVFPRNIRYPENLDRAADYIREALSLTGARVSDQEYEAGGVECRNIIAHFGPDKEKLLIIGAHYDACGDQPGADDNASGVAGLLELARLLGERNYDSPIMLIAYSTEEPPFFRTKDMGSAVHARSLRTNNIEIHGMICLEMIGYFCDRQLTDNVFLRILYPRSGDFIAVVGRWSDRSLIRKIKKCFRGASDLRAFSYSGPIIIGADLSDHLNYWLEGYQAVMITDTAFLRNPHYHTSSDTADTLDYQRMASVVDGVLSSIFHLQLHE